MRRLSELGVSDGNVHGQPCTDHLNVCVSCICSSEASRFTCHSTAGSMQLIKTSILDKKIFPVHSNRIDKAIFVGSTTGMTHTLRSVHTLSSERLRLGAFLHNCHDVILNLPSIRVVAIACEKRIVLPVNTTLVTMEQPAPDLQHRGLRCESGRIAAQSRIQMGAGDEKRTIYWLGCPCGDDCSGSSGTRR